MGVIIIANHQRKLWNEKQDVSKSKIENISKPSALYYITHLKGICLDIGFFCSYGVLFRNIHMSKIYKDRYIVSFNYCIISLLARLTKKPNTRKVTLVSP